MQPRLEVKLSVNYIYLKLQLHSKGLTKAVEGTDYQRLWAEAEMFAKTNHLFLAPLAQQPLLGGSSQDLYAVSN